ncbi:hypothetical protein [Streptomyces sp. NPDC087300]|uniref:hypothetical protein n=1 Tax=Streptomyces sp. NPDC087300 TaxID=3365780 RepID=UPI00382AAEEC
MNATAISTNSTPRARAAYENWRPPITGVSLLVPVGAHALVVAELLGSISLPTGTVHDGQSPEQAAHHVLQGLPRRLPRLRLVTLAWVQMRRRKVITHVLATSPMTREDAEQLTYRDARADIRVFSTMRAIDEAPAPGRLRLLAALQALTTGETAYLEGDVLRASAPPRFTRSARPYLNTESRRT